MLKYNSTTSHRAPTHLRTAIPLAFIFLFVFFLVEIILLSSSFGASISIGSPQAGASYWGQFNVSGAVTAAPGKQLMNFQILVNGSAYYGLCDANETCSFDFYASHGNLVSGGQGDNTVYASVVEDGVLVQTPVQTFTVDHTPIISLSSPSGNVQGGAFTANGTVQFAPGDWGGLYLYLDGYSIDQKLFVSSESFSFNDGTLIQGPHTVTVYTHPFIATTNPPTASASSSFTADFTPALIVNGPTGSVGKYYNITGHVSFKPGGGPNRWGTVYAAVDGASVTWGVGCYTPECDFTIPAYSTVRGSHSVNVVVAPQYGPQASSTTSFYSEDLIQTDNPPQTPGNICPKKKWGSSTNVISGNMEHSQQLFSVSGGSPLATDFSIYYSSRDELDIPIGGGNSFNYKLPLGQGWSHSYDISLFANPDGTTILKGGGLAKRFFTPAGSFFVSQPGDSSALVRNANGTYTITHRDGLKYTFSTTGVLTSIIDRFNNTVTITDNGAPSGKIVSITDPAGHVTTLTYNSYNEKILSITDPGGKVFNLTYNGSFGLLTQVAYPLPVAGASQPIWNYAYNTFRLMESKTDPELHVTHYSYDAGHRATSTTSPDNGVKSMAYGSGQATLTEENGGQWTYAYNSNGLLTAKTDPSGNTTSYTYDASRYLATETAPVDAATSYVKAYQHDVYGNVTDVQGHVRHLTVPPTDDPVDLHYGLTYAYSNFDQLASVTNLLDSPVTTTSIAYDTDQSGFKRITATDPASNQTVVRLETTGLPHDVTEPGGAVRSFTYDSSRRLASVTDSSGAKAVLSNYDGKGNAQTVQLIDATSATRQTMNFQYDALGRTTTQIVPGSLVNYVTSLGYNRNGDIASITDANLNLTTYLSNFRGQVTQITDALQKVTALSYVGCPSCGGNGKLTSLTDANGNTTSFEYDAAGKLHRDVPPVGDALRYDYTPAGLTWHKYNDRTGQVLITYSYDPQRRLTGRAYADGTSDSFTYTLGGRLATASNQNIGYTFGYDNAGQLTSVTDSNGRVVNYTYQNGLRQSMTALPGTPDQHVINYGYSAGKISNITSSLAGAFGYGYDSLGRRTSLSYPNGITASYSYNQDQPSWLAGISYTGNQPVYSVSYPTFDLVGNRMSKVENSATLNYAYDLVYRLLSVSGSQIESFTYDAAGNRLTEAGQLYTVGAGNTLQAAKGKTYSYDCYGNTISDGTWAYSWNPAGEMTVASKPGITVEFKYDSFGRRIEKKTTTGSTITTFTYLYDGENIAATISGGAVTHFIHGSRIDEHLAMIKNGLSYFYHTDGLGSIVRITDTSQNTVQSYSYASFGSPTIGNPSFVQPYLFTGREYDPETGLNYHWARYLDMSTGRWLSRDPIGLAAGDVVLTNYAQNNPVNLSDPFGLEVPSPGLTYPSYQNNPAGRAPDFVTFSVNVGSSFGINPVNLTIDRYGNVYYGGGASPGRTSRTLSGSLVRGELNECDGEKPDEFDLKRFLSGPGFGTGGGFIIGGGIQWSVGNSNTATVFGFYTPQLGSTFTGSRKIGNIGISW